MRKVYSLLILIFALFLNEKNASAVTYRYPLAFTSFTGGMNYCDNRAAQPLSFTFSTTTCGAGGNANVNITVTWYSNVINSNSGGVPVQTITSTAATTTFIYVPQTTPVGTLYYYATVSWVAIGCVTAGSITTATTQQVTINSCPASADMPDPPTNLITVPAGSYVIPMDNSHQDLWLTYPFNIKAYGLVDTLLLDDIPVYWVIKSGKAKDSSDFSAVASRVYPTASAAALQYFKASEFIIDTTYLNRPHYAGEKSAIQVMNSFAKRWKVAVYQLSSNTAVDIRYTLHQRPKIACFNNGTYQQVATKLLDSAKMNNFVAISAGVFTGLADCYTFCTEMHWSTATLADSPTMAPVWQFVQEGGNFLGQCAGENTYENLMQSPRHFHTTNGTVQYGTALPANHYTNADMAFAQFQGSVVPRSGTTANWHLAAGSSFDTETYNLMYSVTRDTIVAAARHYGSPDSVGGNVFFLGGHDYMSNTATQTDADSVGSMRYINGSRMFLNACLVPAHRPTAFVLDPGTNKTICSGDSVKLGGSPTGPAGSTYSWSPASGLSSTTVANPMASPSVTTTYTVIAFDGSCQGGPDVVTVTVNPKPATPTASSNSPICAGSTLSLTTPTVAGATYSWTGPNAFISSLQNPTIANATVAASGTYSVTVTVGGCTSAPGTVTVTVNPSPAMPTVGSNSPICAGSTLSLTTPTVAGATYSWTGPNAFASSLQNPTIANATVAASGTYSLTITVAGCSSPVATINVTVNPIPATPTATSNSPICAGSTLNLSTPTVAGATYSWTGPNGFLSGLQNPNIANATVAASGTYSVTVTVNGCTSAAGTVVVTVSPIPATPTAGSNSPICAGSTLSLTTPTVAGATYSWTGPNGFSSGLQNPTIANATIAASGTYSVTVTVGGCASAAGTVVVTVNPTPATPTASSNSPVCAGSTLNLSTPTVAGATYSWTGPNGFLSGLQNPSIANATVAASGTYSVTVTVAGCTSAAGTVTVTVNPTPATPTASSNSPICAGSTLNLTTPTVAGATYSWTGPNGFSSPLQNPSIANATVAASGTYSVTVTVAGCTSAAGTVNVTVNPIPATPTASSNSPVCSGTTLTLSTPTVAGATYSWTGPNGFVSALQNPTRANMVAADAGTYSVTVTVAGCASADGTVTVIVNPTPATPTASSNSPVCSGNTINLSTPTVAGATYSWTGPNGFSSPLQNPSIANAVLADAGTYSVTVAVGGCTSAVGTVNVVVNPTPAAPTATSNSPVCEGSTLNLFTPTVAGATYSWTGPNAFVSSAQNPSIPGVTLAAAGTYTVTVTVNGCTSPVGTVTVVIGTTPATPTASSNSPVCAGSTLNLSTPTVAGATYSWTGPNAFVSALQNPSIANATLAAAGTYSLTVTVGGCSSAVGTVTVVVNPTPATPTASSNSPICAGSTLNLTTPTVAGATYNWTGPNAFSSSAQNPSIANATVAASGTYSVTVTVGGCTSAAGTVNVTVNPIPATPTASSNSPVCSGTTLTLFTPTVAGATYSWTGPNGFVSALQNPTRANMVAADAGTYSVTVTVAGCASADGTVTVVVNPTPATPTASSNSPVCSGNTINLSTPTVAGATYSWTGPNAFSSSAQNPSITNATIADAGTYSVTVTVGGCTSAAGTVNVIVNPTPAAPTATSNSPVCEGSTLNLFTPTVAGATYSWTGPNAFVSSAQNPSIPGVTLAAAGTYTVTVTVGGCTSPVGTVTVVIGTTPATPTASSNSPVCAGSTLNLSTPTVAGATYSWTGPNAFVSALQNPSIANATLAAAGTYSLTITVGGCTSAVGTVTVVVNPTPAAPTASSNSPLCKGSTLNLSTPTVAGATYSWTGPNAFASSAQNPTIPNVQSADAGTYTITVTVAGCTSQPGTVNVVVDTPAVVSAGSNVTVCANNDSILLNGTSSTGQGQWSTSGSGTFSPNNFALNATYVPSSADTTAGSVTLTLTSRNNGACAPVTNTITVIFTHAPKAEAGNNVTVCANNAAVNLNGTVSIASGGIWSTSGTGTFSPNNTTLNATYNPSNADTTAGSVLLILTTTGNGACKAVTDSMTITFTHAPNVNAGNNDTVCANNPNVSLNGSSSTGQGQWSTSGTGTFTPNNTTLNATYNASPADTVAGSVTLTLTSTGNGTCLPVSKTIVITITHSPSVNPGSNVTVCANNDSVQLNGVSTTGAGHWTTSGSGTFSPNSNTLNAIYVPSNADTTAGSVTLTLTSTANGRCLAASRQMTITFTHAPTAEAGNNFSVCENNAVVTLNGSFSSAATGGIWSTSGSGTFSPNNTTMNATYTPSPADTAAHSVLIILTTTGNGLCKAVTDSLTITYTKQPAVEAGRDTVICLNSPNYTLNGSSSTGSGTWTTLGSGVFVPNNNTLNATYQPSNADTTAKIVTLILTSTNNGGCNPVFDTVVLRYTDIPVVNAGTNQTVCANNATVSLNATSSTNTGIWTTSGTGTFSPNNTTLNATYNPSTADTTAGTVTLTFTSTGGCIPVSQSITITITDAPNVEAGANQSVCKNAASLVVNLNGTVGGGATTGIWSTNGSGIFSPNNTTLNATYTPSSADTTAGIVTLILTSTGNGNCLAVSDTMTIQYTKPPVTEAGNNITGCANNSIPLNGTVTGGSGTGIWTTPNGSGTFVPNNTTLNGSYIPSNADTAVGNIILILTSTNNGGCQPSVDSVIITVLPGPIVEAGPNQNICKNNDNVGLAGTIKHATGGIWSTTGSGTLNPNNTTLNATYVPSSADTTAGTVTLILTSTGNGLCNSVVDSMTVIFTPSPKVEAGNNIFICTGTTTANLNGSVWDGSATGKWTTLGTGSFSPNDSTLNATYNLSSADTAAKTVTLILTSTNNGGCLPVTDTVTVKITPIPTVEAGNDTTACKNNANVVLNGIITGGSGTGVWTTSGTGTFTPNDSVLNATYNASNADTAAGSVTLILTATNACKLVSDTVTITYTPAPTVNPGSNATICAGELVNLGGSVSVATGGKWSTSGDGTFMPNDSALNATYIPGSNDTARGTVKLYLTTIGNGGCLPVKDSIVVTIQSKPTANFKSAPACLNSSINFIDLSTNSRGAITSWFWNFGNGTSTIQNPSNTYNTVGLQTVTLGVSTAAGCKDTVTKQVYVNPNPTANYTSSTYCSDSAMFTDRSVVSPGGIKSWLWSFGDSNKSNLQDPNHTYLNPGTYTVTLVVISDSGCSAAYLDTVTVKNCQNEISPPAIPTAFTPNGDGNNDVLLIRGGPFTQLDFRVFTEWGTQVFRSTTQTEGWDGKYNGKAQPEGTYTWTLVGTTADGKNYKMTGNVTILR